jgi:hypothetical protein
MGATKMVVVAMRVVATSVPEMAVSLIFAVPMHALPKPVSLMLVPWMLAWGMLAW